MCAIIEAGGALFFDNCDPDRGGDAVRGAGGSRFADAAGREASIEELITGRVFEQAGLVCPSQGSAAGPMEPEAVRIAEIRLLDRLRRWK